MTTASESHTERDTRRKYPELNLTQLKHAIDSPAGLDPMPVEHHEFPMKHPKLISRAVTEFMSVVYGKTIRNGHRSPVAVHPGGNKLYTLKDVAADRGWSDDWTQRVFRQACACGLVRAGKGARNDFPPAAIVLCGRVNPVEIQEDSSTNELVGPEGTLRKRLSAGEYQQYEKLSPDVREKFLEENLRGFLVDDRIEADAIRLARHYNEQRHAERLTRYGITPDPSPAKRYLENPVVELKLVPEGLEAAAASATVVVRSEHSEEPAGDAHTNTGVNAPVYTPKSSAVSFSGFPEVSSPEEKLEDPRAVKPRSDDGSPSVGRSHQQPETNQARSATEAPNGNARREVELAPELAAIAAAIPPYVLEIVGDVPGPALLRSIARKLQGAPPDRLTPRIRKRKWTKDDTLGMLERIALDIGRAWKLGEQSRAAVAADAEENEARDKRDQIVTATRILSDPTADPSDVKFAREILEFHGIAPPAKVRTAGGD